MSRHSRLLFVLAPGLAFSKVAFALTVNVMATPVTACLPDTGQTTCDVNSVAKAIAAVNAEADPANTIQITSTYDVTAVTGNDGDAEVDIPILGYPTTVRSDNTAPATNPWKLRTVRTTASLTLENLVIKSGDLIVPDGCGEEQQCSAVDADFRDAASPQSVTATNVILEDGNPNGIYHYDYNGQGRSGAHGVIVMEGDLTLTDVTASDFTHGQAVVFWDNWTYGGDGSEDHDLTITDGTFVDNSGSYWWAASVNAYNPGTVTLTGSTFDGGEGDLVYQRGGDLNVATTTFKNAYGTAVYYQADGGEYMGDGAEGAVNIADSFFTDNQDYDCCEYSAALVIDFNQWDDIESVAARIENTAFSGNHGSYYNGGAGDIWWGWIGDTWDYGAEGGGASTLDVIGSTFDGGEGDLAGSIYLGGGRSRFKDTSWDGLTVSGGEANANGAGAITLSSGDLECLRCTFTDTHGAYGPGAVDIWGWANTSASFTDTTFTGTGSKWDDGGALEVGSGARVDLDGVRFVDTEAPDGAGGALALWGAWYWGGYNEDCYEGCWLYSEPPYMYGGEAGALVYGRDVTIDGATAITGGGFSLYGQGNTLVLTDSLMQDTAATYSDGVPVGQGYYGPVGGLGYADQGNTIEIHDSVIGNTSADFGGGVLFADPAPLYYYNGGIEAPLGGNGGPFDCWYAWDYPGYEGDYFGSTWVLDGVEQSGAETAFMGSVAVFGRFDRVSITGSSFTGNVSGVVDGGEGPGYGTIVALNPSRFEASCNTFCGNTVREGGSAIHLFDDGFPDYPDTDYYVNRSTGDETSGMLAALGYYGQTAAKDIRYEVRNNTFNGNTTDYDYQGGTVYYDVCNMEYWYPSGPGNRGSIQVENNTFVGNFGGEGNLAGASGDAGIDVRNNLFQDGEVGWYIEADTLWGYPGAQTSRYVEGGYNLYGTLTTADVVDETFDMGFGFGFPDDTDVLDPAIFRSYTPGDCASELYLEPGPGVDQGDPDESMNDNWEVTPGTPNPGDIGAFGGPDACVPDGDCDDYNAILDCDDTVGTTFPGSDEVPYDGIDQDCSGADLCDVDADGVAAAFGTCAGTDCNDLNAAIHPGATDILDDGIDQDCSGSDAVTDEDVDNDGHPDEQYGGHDCDDSNAAINPTAEDIPYDGIDQDCDGSDLIDVDCDGFASSSVTNCPTGIECTDCNDDDGAIYPGAVDSPMDEIDQDCDGTPAELWAQGGCGCATPAAAPATGGLGFLAAAMAFLRRRRGQR